VNFTINIATPEPTAEPTAVTPTQRVDPAAERARALADVGRPIWSGDKRSDGKICFDRETYLTIDQLTQHWVDRQAISAKTPKLSGRSAR
jgi:hypothetical protein